MRVVITGPTGAVGIALIEKCIQEGCAVLAICRRGSLGISQIPTNSQVKIVEANLEELKDMEIPEMTYDVFYHMGWEGTTGADRENRELQSKNVTHTLDAVKLAGRLGCHTFVGTGSQAEYGRSDEKLTPQTPTHPENEYGRAKLQAGMLSRQECEKAGLKHVWVRILSVYGHGGKDIICKTIEKIKNGEDALFTPAEQVWDFLYSEDAANALYLLAERGRHGKVYVLGSGVEKTLKEYLLILKEVLNEHGGIEKKGKILLGAMPYGERQIMYLGADITELTADTGFKPAVTFADGIANMLKR